MANQGDLGNKLSEKLHFPQNDLNYSCENFSFVGASAIENSQHYSKPASDNESRDEG